MSDTLHDTLSRLKASDREILMLNHIQAVLLWDQETGMPPGAIEDRAAQIALLQRMIHKRVGAEWWERDFERLGVDESRPAGDPSLAAEDRALLRRLWHRYSRAIRLPVELVSRLAETTSKGQAIWATARECSDFDLFAPHLKLIVELLRETTDHIGWKEHRYDALLDEYEPWMKTATVERIFTRLQPQLSDLMQRIMVAQHSDDSPVRGRFPAAAQRSFSDLLLQKMGYDLRRGRLDQSAHPFTTTLGFDDVRITTRFREDLLLPGIFGTIHELGHALYELGIDRHYRGGILADGTSLGIHESQSRYWENFVGKSHAFWQHFFPHLRRLFPEQLGALDSDRFWRIVNRVEPSSIRIDADEVSYNLHIVLRFNLEIRLIEGSLEVEDLPEAWREASRSLLGIVPERDADGVLQDIHWSTGALGYFPTYTLGNLYAAQFLRRQLQDMPNLYELTAEGHFEPIREWLRERIHRHGSLLSAEELCLEVTGEALNPDYFIDYLTGKFNGMYGV